MRLFDIRPPPAHLGALPAGIEFIVGDLRRFADVDAAAGGVCAVFHVASYGMSGSEQLRPQLIHDVNCGGTDAVIQACLRNGVPRLVYTSTYNVVFGGALLCWPLLLALCLSCRSTEINGLACSLCFVLRECRAGRIPSVRYAGCACVAASTGKILLVFHCIRS